MSTLRRMVVHSQNPIYDTTDVGQSDNAHHKETRLVRVVTRSLNKSNAVGIKPRQNGHIEDVRPLDSNGAKLLLLYPLPANSRAPSKKNCARLGIGSGLDLKGMARTTSVSPGEHKIKTLRYDISNYISLLNKL